MAVFLSARVRGKEEEEEVRKQKERGRYVRGKRRGRAAMWEWRGGGGDCRRKRHKQLISQHREEMMVQRWRHGWGRGTGRLPLSAQLAVAGRT